MHPVWLGVGKADRALFGRIKSMYSSALACLTALVFTANPYLEEGRSLYQALRFREAESRLRLARENPANTPEETAEIFDLLARSVSAFGRFDEAQEIYEELLAKNPHASAPSHASPSIVDAFLGAKKRLYSPEYVKLSLGKVLDGALEVSLVDPWQRADHLVLLDGAGERTELVLKDHRATVERAKSGGESRLEAQSDAGQTLAVLDLSLVRPTPPASDLPAVAALPAAAPVGGLATSAPPAHRSKPWLIAAGSGTAATLISTGIFAWRGLSEKRQLDSSVSRGGYDERISSLSPDQYRSLQTRANRDLTLAVASASASLILGAVTLYLWNQE